VLGGAVVAFGVDVLVNNAGIMNFSRQPMFAQRWRAFQPDERSRRRSSQLGRPNSRRTAPINRRRRQLT
jgi:hypothetical protein